MNSWKMGMGGLLEAGQVSDDVVDRPRGTGRDVGVAAELPHQVGDPASRLLVDGFEGTAHRDISTISELNVPPPTGVAAFETTIFQAGG